MLSLILHAALRQQLAISPAADKPKILALVAAIHTRSDAMVYLAEVQNMIRTRKA